MVFSIDFTPKVWYNGRMANATKTEVAKTVKSCILMFKESVQELGPITLKADQDMTDMDLTDLFVIE